MLYNLADPAVKRAHDRMLQLLAGAHPESRDEIRRRLQDKREGQFQGAMLELTTAEVFNENISNATVLPHHGATGASKPDFDLLIDELLVAQAECTVFRSGMSGVEQEMSAASDLIRQCGRHMRVPGFALSVKEWSVGHSTPSLARLAKRFDDYLSTLVWNDSLTSPPDEVEITDEKSGWTFVVAAIPLNDSQTVPVDRCGMISSGMTALNEDEALRRAVKAKLEQHEAQQAPLIVVVCCTDWWDQADRDSVYNLLLGKTVYNLRLHDESPPVPSRMSGGLFVDDESACTRLAGILTMSMGACFPWASGIKHTLWVNPRYATSALVPAWRGPMVTWNMDSGDMVERNVQVVAEG